VQIPDLTLQSTERHHSPSRSSRANPRPSSRSWALRLNFCREGLAQLRDANDATRKRRTDVAVGMGTPAMAADAAHGKLPFTLWWIRTWSSTSLQARRAGFLGAELPRPAGAFRAWRRDTAIRSERDPMQLGATAVTDRAESCLPFDLPEIPRHRQSSGFSKQCALRRPASTSTPGSVAGLAFGSDSVICSRS